MRCHTIRIKMNANEIEVRRAKSGLKMYYNAITKEYIGSELDIVGRECKDILGDRTTSAMVMGLERRRMTSELPEEKD